MTTAYPFEASDLCAPCGLCCNGVMFRMVILQPGDSAKDLTALGLKIKRKNRQQHVPQPCPAYRDSQCTIYLERPVRCRLFVCRQFQKVASGEISKDDALKKIREAREQVEHINHLLQKAGVRNDKKRLSKNVERFMAEPLDATSDPTTVQLRNQIKQAMQELQALLNQDFRITPLDSSL